MDKPPIGIMPRYRWLELRAHELAAAIQRYTEHGDSAQALEWSHELTWVLSQIKPRVNPHMEELRQQIMGEYQL